MFYNEFAQKKPTNLSLNSELISKAKQFKLNISKICEKALEEELKLLMEKEWLEKNKKNIDYYNQFVSKEGTFGDIERKF